MQLRNLAIGVGVLALGAGAVYLLENRGGEAGQADPRVGKPLVDPAAIEQVEKIRLTGEGAARVELLQDESGRWILPERDGLPASFNSLSRMINRLTEVEVARFVTRNPQRLERLEPKSSSIEVFATRGSEEPALALHFGRRSDRGGPYVQFGDDPAAYLAAEFVSLNTNLESWVDKALFPFEPGDVASVTIELEPDAPLETVAFTRPAGGEAFGLPEDLAGEWELETQALDDWLRTLANLRFTRDEAMGSESVTEAMEHARKTVLETADGWTWTVLLGRRPDEALPPAATVSEDGEGAEPAEPGTHPAGPPFVIVTPAAPDGETVPPYFSKLAFEVPAYSFTRQPDFSDLLRKPEPATTE